MSLHRPQSGHPARGATLLEFLVYVAIIGVVLTTATSFAVEFVNAQAKAAAIAEAVRNARFAASRMEIEIREASDVNAGSSVFGSNPGTLSLATANVGTNPTVFTVSGGALNVQQGGGAVIPLTNSKVDVQEFTVENVSTAGKTKAIRIHLKVAAKNAGNLVEQAASTVVESTVRIESKDGFSN
ncbi:MAG: hypothetical protein RL272_326 [Candidatus Parcubacteria bacterium]|jgi:Tfp pilus assembly protein FimT